MHVCVSAFASNQVCACVPMAVCVQLNASGSRALGHAHAALNLTGFLILFRGCLLSIFFSFFFLATPTAHRSSLARDGTCATAVTMLDP